MQGKWSHKGRCYHSREYLCDTSAVVTSLITFYTDGSSWFIVLTPFSSLKRHSTFVSNQAIEKQDFIA